MLEVMTDVDARSSVVAVLGPTNTGKTHLAMERMLGHASGMIGFPLRLLARENYDKVVRQKGRSSVALITGEEKIVPPNARYLICTVESMPLDRAVDFLAVDEIQLCADPERGHVFTNRLLHARGTSETMFLGAETIRDLVRRLVPQASFIGRPRFSSLSFAGTRKLTRLRPRTAVVAFSAADVYRMAELMRRHRGGTAVVLGALSPRTRNAQVDMYQAGEVDYLVATDAIGMGLNMEIDHVAFARLSKFDGRSPRRLSAAEIAQIAGRAGRHMSDGTFGTTEEAGDLDPEIVEAVETHTFEPLKSLLWRNAGLDFSGPSALLASLEAMPPERMLRRSPEADDHLALRVLVRDPEIAQAAGPPAATRLLWEVCQIPDFRKILTDAHTRLQATIFKQLIGPSSSLATDWIADHIARLDRTDGDIDALVTRIAHVRTWTYISHRPHWLDDPRHWQERARTIEDKLSDRLHDRLTQRFVDRRSALLVRSMARGGDLVGAVARSGEVLVEGVFVGRLDGFRFQPDATALGEDSRALLSAARRALRREISARVRRLETDDDAAFSLGDYTSAGWNTVLWHGAPVGRLAPGATWLSPTVIPLSGELLEPAERDRVGRRLERWMVYAVERALRPLVRLRDARLTGAARGIAFQLVEAQGGLPRVDLAGLIGHLDPAGRRGLAGFGVRLGAVHVFCQPALKPRPAAMRALLWAVAERLPLPPPIPPAGSPSVVVADDVPPGFYRAVGYAMAGRRAIRWDRLEALAVAAATLHAQGPFAAGPELAQIVGIGRADVPAALALLGYHRRVAEDGTETFVRRRARRRRAQPKTPHQSPFAKLRELRQGS